MSSRATSVASDNDSGNDHQDCGSDSDSDSDASFAREAAERIVQAALEATASSSDADDCMYDEHDITSSESLNMAVTANRRSISISVDRCVSTVADADSDVEADDEDDVLATWQQFVFQRPEEGLMRLDVFASSDNAFDHLLVLNLQQNALQDISPLVSVAKTLRVLNVSYNALVQLPSVTFWRSFTSLRLCFVAHNKLQHWRDVAGLEATSASLLWLTLRGNPLMALANARAFVVNRLPRLRALDDFIVTDCEYMRTSGTSTRFAAMALGMSVARLAMPLEFVDDNVALAYVKDTEARVQRVHEANSPSIIVQRAARGFLSRSRRFPRLSRMCARIVKLQACVRGFLLRQLLVRSFEDLVAANGLQHLLTLSSTDSPLLPTLARRGLKKLVVYIQAWQRKFHAKKQAIAIKKIRFWCQMAYQRYVHKSKRLLQDEHQVCVYYTPAFETELLAIAEKAAHRDPYLMAMPPSDRTQFIRARCTLSSGVSVLRTPHQSTGALQVDSPMVRMRHRTQQPQQSHASVASGGRDASASVPRSSRRKAVGNSVASMAAVVRVFPSDFARENDLLVTEKQFLLSDLALLAKLQHAHRLAVASVDMSAPTVEATCRSSLQPCSESNEPSPHKLPRAVLVHVTQLASELEKRLMICNKKILAACIKYQQWQTRMQRMRFALSHAAIRARGHCPMRYERNKFVALLRAHPNAQSAQYTKLRVLVPWSIDMYLQILATLDRSFAHSCGPAFALSYEQTRKLHAAVSIQSAWRAFARRTRRHALEVALARARLCLQRWWRFRSGLRRRLDIIRACVLLSATVTTQTLFVEASVYHALASASSWSAVRAVLRPCKEQRLHCRMSDSSVEVVLSPAALLLRSHAQRMERSTHGLGHAVTPADMTLLRAAGAQRCSASLPVWLPGAPAHHEVSMSARGEDATPLLLVDNVVVEPMRLERDLLLRLSAQQQQQQRNIVDATASESSDVDNAQLLQRFAVCRRVADTSKRVVELSQRLASANQQRYRPLESTALSPEAIATTTPFVRLTFASVSEARKRALVLLCKTFDPVTKHFAQLYSIEALVGALLRHHQWALEQIAAPEESTSVLADCAKWLHVDVPTPWWLAVQRKLNASTLAAIVAATRTMAASPSPVLSMQPTRPDSAPSKRPAVVAAGREHRHRVLGEARATSSPISTLIPRPPHSPARQSSSSHNIDKPPLHVVVLGGDSDSEITTARPLSRPSTPSSASVSSPASSSRHQLLTDRMGKPLYATLDGMRDAQLEHREGVVRDLREERERAAEALIIDRRILQREHAAEIAGIRLDMDVKLQRLRYAHAIDRLDVRERIEHDKVASSKRSLTRRFEQRFAAQTGAMMRLAARESVGQQHDVRHAARTELAASNQQRTVDARERRQDAKSYWFVRNQRTKADAGHERVANVEQRDERAQLRRVEIHKRIQEDKEIKAMLRIV